MNAEHDNATEEDCYTAGTAGKAKATGKQNAGEEEPAGDQTNAGDNNPAPTPSPVGQDTLKAVRDHLVETVDTRAWVRAKDLAAELDIDSVSQVGIALAVLSSTGDDQLVVDRWTAPQTRPTRWYVQRVEGDGGMVQACPDCDSTNIQNRSRRGGFGCTICGAHFDAPVERERRAENGPQRGTTAHILDDMSVEEFDEQVRTDGGTDYGGLTVLPFSHTDYAKLRRDVFPTLRRRDKFGAEGEKVGITVGSKGDRDAAGEARILNKETVCLDWLPTAFLCWDTETSLQPLDDDRSPRARAVESLNSFYRDPIEVDEPITLYWLRWTERFPGVLG